MGTASIRLKSLRPRRKAVGWHKSVPPLHGARAVIRGLGPQEILPSIDDFRFCLHQYVR